MHGPGDGWAGRGGGVIFLWPIFSYRSRCIRINLEVPAVSEIKSETNWLRKSHKTILGFKTSGAVRANLAKTKLNFAYCRNSAFEMNVQNRNEKSKSTWKWKLMLDFKLTCLAYSTFLKQVRQLQLQLISLFDVCFPILLFGIFKFSFLVHIWECRRWPREAPHVNSLFYMLEASKITSNESDLFIWCLLSDSTLWNSQIILNCTYFRFGSAWGDQRGASHE
jgi:hypothetical protein